VIFDADGTLSSVAHRVPYLDKGDWSRFHGEMYLDAPIAKTIAAARRHKARGDAVIVLSMRPERFRAVTERWLKEAGVPYDEVHLRPEGDPRSGTEVKRDIYRRKIAPRYDVVRAYDDHQPILDMWREEGVPALRVTDPVLPPLPRRPAPDPKVRPGAKPVGRRGMLVYVPPHQRVVRGRLIDVDGYWRRLADQQQGSSVRLVGGED
jgi:hypothetical protein